MPQWGAPVCCNAQLIAKCMEVRMGWAQTRTLAIWRSQTLRLVKYPNPRHSPYARK